MPEKEINTPWGKKKIKVPEVKLIHGLKGQKLEGAENILVSAAQLQQVVLPDRIKGDSRFGHVFIPYFQGVLDRLAKDIGQLKN